MYIYIYMPLDFFTYCRCGKPLVSEHDLQNGSKWKHFQIYVRLQKDTSNRFNIPSGND